MAHMRDRGSTDMSSSAGAHTAQPTRLSSQALEQVDAVTVHLRDAPYRGTLSERLAVQTSRRPAERRFLSAAELRSWHGADDADVERVGDWARGAGLEVGDVDAATRRMTVHGPLGRLSEAFRVSLVHRHTPDWRTGLAVDHRDHLDPPLLPVELDGVVTAVIGLNDRPVARPRLISLPRGVEPRTSFTPEDLADVYAFPRLPDGGAGSTITVGIAELAGALDAPDVAAFQRAHPNVRIIEEAVNGAAITPDPFGADTEVALDWQVIARVLVHCAPRADLRIVIKYAANTDRGFTDVEAAFCSDGRDYAAVSTSWGAPENLWSPAAMDAMDRAFAMSAVRGIVHSNAAGDNGSTDGRHDRRQHADHPASAPHGVGCGGTRLIAERGRRISEVVWNRLAAADGATGGGVSDHFVTPPAYQWAHGILPVSANDGHVGRGVPDVAGNADPQTGYLVTSAGERRVVGGTSAVAPLWTALFALIAAGNGQRLGHVLPALYAAPAAAFTDITQGDNGAYQGGVGWDAATGRGVPVGTVLAEALASGPPSPRVRVPVGQRTQVNRERVLG